MARYTADQNKNLFKYESGTYAQASGAGQWLGLVQNHEINEDPSVEAVRYEGSADRNVDLWVEGEENAEGTITSFPQDFKAWVFALGSIVDGGSPSPYSHTIKQMHGDSIGQFTSGAQNPFISRTLESSKTAAGTGKNFIRTVAGAVTDTLKWSWQGKGIVEQEETYVGQSVAFSSGATTAVTATTLKPFRGRDIKLHIPSGTVVDNLMEGEVVYNNNLNRDTHYQNGSATRDAPIPENADWELNLKFHKSSEWAKTYYDQYFKGGSEFNMMLEVNDSSAGAGSRDGYFIFSGCRLAPFSAPDPVEGTNENELTIRPKNGVIEVNDLVETYGAW